MAIDNRLQVFNEEGQSVDYDILASDVKFLPDGKDLPTKLAELEHEIEDAGQGDGTVTGVKVGSTTYPPNGDGVVDISPAIPDVSGKANKSEMSVVPGTGANADKTTITLKEGTNATVLTQHQDISGKVDKETGKVLIPSTDLAKLQNLPTADQLTTQLGQKANDNAVVKSVTINGETPAATPDQNGNVNIEVEGEKGDPGITPHIGTNGNWWLGPETDSSNDTGIHAQGPAGTSYTSADIVISNIFNTQSGVLGMGGALIIKQNIDSLYASLSRLYNKLASIAFWDSSDQSSAEPTILDWSTPRATITINAIANTIVTNNGAEVGSSFLAAEGSQVELLISPAEHFSISSLSADEGTLTDNQNGTFSLQFTVSGNMSITFTGSVIPVYDISYSVSHGTHSAPQTIISGGTATIILQADYGYTMPESLDASAVVGATIVSYTRDQNDSQKATLVISNPTENVTITIAAIEVIVPKLVPRALVVVDSSRYSISYKPARATILQKRVTSGQTTGDECTWGGTSSEADHNKMAQYTTIPIPSGTAKVSFKVTGSSGGTVYYFGVTIVNASGAALNSVQWELGGSTANVVDISGYTAPTHVCVNLKIGSAGTATFGSTETLASIGAELAFLDSNDDEIAKFNQ